MFNGCHRIPFVLLTLLLSAMLWVSSCKKSKPSPEELPQDDFECQITFLKSHTPVDFNEYYPEILQRRQEAIAMLSNGVLDRRVLILDAYVDKKPSQFEPPPTIGNSPRFILFVIDERKQIAYAHYSQSNDPNDFGNNFFDLSNYYSIFFQRSTTDFHPIYHWSLYLKGYDIGNFNLIKCQSYSIWDVLETPRSSLDALVENRGQIILYDRNYKVLDRFFLRPRPKLANITF